MKDNLVPTTSSAVEAYESTINIFQGLFREIKELSKKKNQKLQ